MFVTLLAMNLFFLRLCHFLAKKRMLVREFKTSVLNGQTCLSPNRLETVRTSCLATEPAYVFWR